ncbi:MAG: thymidylate kinase, partial [bacterium]|nr:thymidylate kinase [bacterium]
MSLLDRFTTPKSIKAKGKFIVIDGADGTGKTTQIDLLAKTLIASQYDGVLLQFPQNTDISAPLLNKFHDGNYGELNPEAVSILYAIDRLDTSAELRNYLADGKVVLAHRYVTSNAGEQGARITNYHDRIKFYKWLDNLEYTTFGIARPDLNIILHLPADIAWETIKQRMIQGGKAGELHSAQRAYF